MLASASVLRSDRTGRPLYVILQTTNIDRQKRAEAALLYTESRWNSALEAAKQGVWEHDARRTGEMYYSPMWRKMRGFSPYEHVDGDQEAWLSRLHPDDRERIRAIVGKQEHGDDGYDTLEYRERHKDGHYIWILSRGRPVEWDEDGNVVRTIGTDTDITRLKEVEHALAEEKERLRVTLESIGDGVISTDAERRISFMNPIAEEMTGWSSEEAVGKNLAEVFQTVDHATGAPSIDPVAESLNSGRLYYLDEEVVLVGRSGERRDIRSSAAPVQHARRQDDRRRARLPGHHPEPGAAEAAGAFGEPRCAHRACPTASPSTARSAPPWRARATRAGRTRSATSISTASSRSTTAPVTPRAMRSCGRSSDTIRRCCRAHDFAARLGGDEFAILLMDCSTSATRRPLPTRSSMRSPTSASPGTERPTASAPASASRRSPGDSNSALGVTGEADAACYAAKRAGRGRVVVYSEHARGAGRNAGQRRLISRPRSTLRSRAPGPG